MSSPAPGPEAPPQPECRDWKAAGLALIYSAFPGCGHLYNGEPRRALLWSVFFLAAFLPLSMLAYISWSFTPVIYPWLAAGIGTFYLACAIGPALRALRRRRAPPEASRPRPAYASLPALGIYAALVTFGGVLELTLFSSRCFVHAKVQSSRLEPLLGEREQVTVLVSTHVRPIHGEVVLFQDAPERSPDGTSTPRPFPPLLLLGRILAVPGDSVAAQGDKLLVNALELEPSRPLRHKEFERAGRREKLRHLLSPRGALPLDGSAGGAGAARMVRWGSGAWGPFVVPKETFLILPDRNEARGPPATGSEARWTAWLVSQDRVCGRVVF